MSFNRAIFRAAVKMALLNKTCAQGRVYDSRLGPLPTDNVNNVLPLICIYTDMDVAKNKAIGNVDAVMRRTVDLQIELTLMQYQAQADGTPVAGIPETDAEAELILDLFEQQVVHALRSPANASSIMHQLVKSWDSWESIPGRWGEGNNKISARTITASCWLKGDCGPIWDGIRRTERANPLSSAVWLEDALAKIASVSTFSTMRTMIAELLGTENLPPVNHVNTINLVFDVAPPVGEIDPDTPHKINAPIDGDGAVAALEDAP